MNDAIGGYFGLELSKVLTFHTDAICLNTARNAFEYILIVKKYRKIYLPYFTCEVLLEPILKLGISYEFYSINEQLEPVFDYDLIQDNEAFLYTNYFGLKNSFIEKTASKIKNVIIDNAQAFYSKPIGGIDTFYSARKFVGVSDGAYLYTDREIGFSLESDQSFERMGHLLKRLDANAEEGYVLFSKNDNSLMNQPIKKMSQLTQKILESVNHELIKNKRLANFDFLHSKLKDFNLFQIDLSKDMVPMVYPYRTKENKLKKRLQENRIYCASYWPNIKEWCKPESIEYQLFEEVIYLPIDQRYDEKEMELIVKVILNEQSHN